MRTLNGPIAKGYIGKEGETNVAENARGRSLAGEGGAGHVTNRGITGKQTRSIWPRGFASPVSKIDLHVKTIWTDLHVILGPISVLGSH
ncbi:hypothetical protein N665_0205s0035 [Sinapis alba]|nr:hypothetical protein N665_0205s0035 [Sinapis alba]